MQLGHTSRIGCTIAYLCETARCAGQHYWPCASPSAAVFSSPATSAAVTMVPLFTYQRRGPLSFASYSLGYEIPVDGPSTRRNPVQAASNQGPGVVRRREPVAENASTLARLSFINSPWGRR